MKYLCLAYEEEKQLTDLSPDDWTALRRETLSYVDSLRKRGQLVVTHALKSARTATSVRVREGETLLTDGPFAETKELLAGFWMIDVKSKADALAWASRVPFADGEVIEVRQVFEAEDFPAEVFPPEEMAREERLRDELQRRAKR
jgi:hypothetical protein